VVEAILRALNCIRLMGYVPIHLNQCPIQWYDMVSPGGTKKS